MKYLAALIVTITLLGAPFAARAGEAPAGQHVESESPADSCVPHRVAMDQLAKLFNEKVVGLGLGSNQESVVELYVSSHGSWTILVTMTNGMSCIAAAGENWTAPDALAGLAS
jgi:hypothetical protein